MNDYTKYLKLLEGSAYKKLAKDPTQAVEW
jgi:hypothetical protein